MADFNININANVQETNNIAGEDLVAGDMVYLSSNGKWYKSSASLSSKSTTELRLACDDALTDASVTLLTYGYYDYGSPILTAGDKYYVSTSSGSVTDQLYLATFNIIRYVGTAYSDSVILFNPDQTYLSEDGTKINEVPLNFEHVHVESNITDLDKYTQLEVDNIILGITNSGFNYIAEDSSLSNLTGVQTATVIKTITIPSNSASNIGDTIRIRMWGTGDNSLGSCILSLVTSDVTFDNIFFNVGNTNSKWLCEYTVTIRSATEMAWYRRTDYETTTQIDHGTFTDTNNGADIIFEIQVDHTTATGDTDVEGYTVEIIKA